ncbi:hypothetical protein NG796_16985 [Laspinema sp. A4]|uniref:hypothetical protein n=1 Tax=Laspinema sp. D2d TaxID=2953686 RepID=UPI0021BA6F05|nr:hypothetical protein [Laspinema sp. D2d]MCT7984969.1 hypothetical protein [Laspinema sp. D2d]
MTEFTDFWSRNGWLCQFQHRDGVVGDCLIITPHVRPPYHTSDRYQGWSVTALESWFQELEEATTLTMVLPQAEVPALDLRIFPTPDGYWCAAWPPMPESEPGQIYVLVRRFSPHPSWRSWDWQERAEASRLQHIQDQLARAAKMIWRAIERG